MPSPKNPPLSPELRQLCKTYLEDTHYSKWNFTDFWDGNEDLLSGCGDLWLRALQQIINTTNDRDKCLAAVAARNKYKGREHLPEASRGRKGKSKGSSKRRKKSKKLNSPGPPGPPGPSEPPKQPSELPPSYEECSQGEETRPEESRSPHEKLYRALSEDRKWYLPTGRSVEGVLFAWVVSQLNKARQLGQAPRESYAHSYILDVDDPDIRGLFEQEEWDAIISPLLPLPRIGSSLESFMHKFADVETATDLRHRLGTTYYLPPGETYSHDKHGDQAWIHSVLTSLLILYEFDHMSCKDNLEAWFQINVWGPIFDRCFQYIPKMSIARSESQSPSNSDRKNPTIMARKSIGSKYDGLITHDQIEYGAVEDSKEFEGEKSKKWTSDSLKLAKLLHDQMRALEMAVKHDKESLGGFRCVGFLTAGLHCQGLFLQYGKGNVCLLQRSRRCDVPKNVSPLTSLIAVLVAVWQMREIVRKSVDNLKVFRGKTDILFQAAVGRGTCIPAILSTCFDTDTEL